MPNNSENPFQAPMSGIGVCEPEHVWQFQFELDFNRRQLQKAIRLYVLNVPLVALSGVSLFGMAMGIVALLEGLYGDSLGGSPYLIVFSLLAGGAGIWYIGFLLVRYITYQRVINAPLFQPDLPKRIYYSEESMSIRLEYQSEEFPFSQILIRGENDEFIVLEFEFRKVLVVPATAFPYEGAFAEFRTQLKLRLRRNWRKRFFMLR